MSKKVLDAITDKVLAHGAAARHPLRVIAGEPGSPLTIGDVEIPCYVLEDETRVLSQRGFLSPNPPVRSGLGVGTRGEGRGTRRPALDSDKWGRWRPLVVVGGADGGPGQRRWGGVGGTACRGRQSRTGPVRLCGSVG